MKKIIIVNILLLFTLCSYCQNSFPTSFFFNSGQYNSSSIKKVVVKKSSWKTYYYYNQEGFLVKEEGYYKKIVYKKAYERNYSYAITDSSVAIYNGKDTLKESYIFDKDKTKCRRCIYDRDWKKFVEQTATFSDTLNTHDQENSVFKESTIVRIYPDSLKEEISISYDKKDGNKDTIISIYDFKKHRNTVEHKFSSRQLYGSLTGVIPYSKEKRFLVITQYKKFNKRGDWRRSYYVTEKGEIFQSKIKISYWK